MARYRILSFDGGGIRGVVSATLLEGLVGKFPELVDSADLIAGTSTGGIIAIGLAAGMSPTELRQLYEDRGKVIFDDSLWDDIVDLGGLTGADYSTDGLSEELEKVLGDKKLSQLNKHVLIPTFDLDNEDPDPKKRSWKPKFFHNFPGEDSDGEELARRVAMYTSAAPTYFPSVDGYIDGGVIANNPSMAALAQTQDKRVLDPPPKLSDIRLLSFGTGKSLTYIQGSQNDWGYAQWARPLISLMLEGSMGVADYQCRKMLGEEGYYRVDVTFDPDHSYPLDDVSKIPKLKQHAQSYDPQEVENWLSANWF